MASALCNLKRYDEAEALLDSIATVSNDSALIVYSYRAKLGVLYNSRQYDKGIALAEEMKKYTKFYRFSIKDLAFILSMELSQKRSESADERLKDMMLKAKSIIDKMNNTSSKNEDLIIALKPHLSEQSQEKADKALRVLKLFEILPYLKELF